MRDRLPGWLRGVNAVWLTVWIFLAVFPFLWVAIISLRDPVDAFSVPPHLIAPVTFEHYRQIWVDGPFLRYAVNTTIVTVFTVLISLGIACPSAYALARYRGRAGFWLLVMALIFRALPPVVMLVAYQPAFLALGIWSRYETLIVVLVAVNQPFTIWMLRAFFVTIPPELDEAALIDGCSRWGAFRRVILPVMGPGLFTAGLFAFLLAYNDFLISSQLMNGDMTTLTAALGTYMGQAKSATKLMEGIAGSVSVIVPVVILVLVFQRNIVSGLTAGAVKG